MKKLEQPLISIIVPVYKVEKYLKRCVDSILTQTYQNMEVILVDDGSPDNCGAICDRYKETDNRVVVIHKKNGGLSDARNAAIPLAKGEYISFIDSDDWVSSYYVEHLYEAVAKCDADIGISWFENGKNMLQIKRGGCEDYISAESLVECIHGLPVKSIEFFTAENQWKEA